MVNAPHPDSGRQKGLSPKTNKDKVGGKVISNKQNAFSQAMGSLPLNLQQPSGGYQNKNSGYLGSKI